MRKLKNVLPMKLVKFLLLLLLIESFLSVDCGKNSKIDIKANLVDSTKTDSFKSVKQFDTLWIASVGDLMCHSQQYAEAQTNVGYDFTYVYTAIQPFINSVDLTFGNLETVTAGPEQRFTGYPKFNTPVEYIEALKYAGFDVITTANNHSLDRSFTGIERTIDALENNNFPHTGTFKTEEDSKNALILTTKGIKLAILAYTFGTNGINPPSGKEFSVNIIDENKMQQDIVRAKESNPDKIVVFLHWGEEYQRQPNSFQTRIADFLFNTGVDIIFGSHPHVIQPMELKTISDAKGKSKEVFIIYSMGNFISNQRKRYTDSGVIVRLKLVKNIKTGETQFGEIDYIPTYVSVSNGFRILPVRESILDTEDNKTDSPNYSPSDYSRLKQVWEETTDHLNIPDKNIYPAKY